MNARTAPDVRRVALYLRISTANGQTTENQRRELVQAAKRHGCQVAAVFEDAGISGRRGAMPALVWTP
jgi:DNA invertase Pin-like site-specific DNA recombinase